MSASWRAPILHIMAPNSAPDSAELQQALAAELPADAVAPGDPERDAVDGAPPSLRAYVDSPAAVAAVLAICQRLDAVVVPHGGGTHLSLGRPPEQVDVLLDLSGLDQVIEYRPEDLTLAVAAGAPLADVQRLLAEAGQMLALDPASTPRPRSAAWWPPICPVRVAPDPGRLGTL